MPTTVLKNKNKIASEIANLNEKEGVGNEWTSEEMDYAMDIYAEQNSCAFSLWRSDISAMGDRRHILSLPIKEQYQLFIKENKL